jgi:hypothetical protein
MQSFPADPVHSRHAPPFNPALTSFADEVCATVARLFAYVGTLALIAILAIHGWDQLQTVLAEQPLSGAGWSVSDHPHRAFALNQLDPAEKSETYSILRHPLGGRRDNPAWRAAISCLSNRLLQSGSEPQPAELFAHAELKRGSCASPAASAAEQDWMTGDQNPRLRGTL